MLNYTNLVIGNGLLTDDELVKGLATLPVEVLRDTSPDHEEDTFYLFLDQPFCLYLDQPLYIVGLTTFDGANAVGAWIDNDKLYLDPVCFTDSLSIALTVGKEHEQVAIFKMEKVVEKVEVKCPYTTVEGTDIVDYAPLFYTLQNLSNKYGGATAVRTSFGYTFTVLGGEGEVIYL